MLSMVGFENMKWYMDNTLPDDINVKNRSDTINIIASFDLLYHCINLLRKTKHIMTHRISVVRDKSIASFANPRNEQTHALPAPLLVSGVITGLFVCNVLPAKAVQ